MFKSKKFIVMLILAVLAFLACTFFTACSGQSYDDSELKAGIQQLKDENQSLKDELTELQKYLMPTESSDVPIYKLGETFTYVSAGIPLFSLTAISNGVSCVVTLKNLNMIPTPPRNFVLIKYQIDDGSFNAARHSEQVLPTGSEDNAYVNITLNNVTQIQIGFPINSTDYIIPYCIFTLV